MKYLVFCTLLIFSSCTSDLEVRKLDYEGHSYLFFYDPSKYGFEVLHNPNCPCDSMKISSIANP